MSDASERARRLVCLTLRWAKTSSAERRRLVETVRPGAILLFGGDLTSLAAELADLRARVPHPLLVLSDVERGAGQQLAGAALLPPPAAIGAAGELDLAREAGLLTGLDMKKAGIEVALAPVLDVQSPDGSAIIGTRAFGSNPARVGAFGRAFLTGLHEAGTLGCAKHFPGHGHVSADTHSERVSDLRPLAAFERDDWLPYRELIAAGLDAVMVAHLACPALDMNEIATRSRPIVTGILRERLGFSGAVFSDALTMKAACDRPEAETAHGAVEAGIDLVLDPADPERLAAHLAQDLAGGTLSRSAVDRALGNLEALNRRSSIVVRRSQDPAVNSALSTQDSALSTLPDRIAEAAVTLLKGALRPGEDLLTSRSIFYLDDDGDFRPGPLAAALAPHALAPLLSPPGEKSYGPKNEVVLFIACRPRMNKGTAGLSAAARAALASLKERSVKIAAAILLGSPWAAKDLPETSLVLCSYGADPASQRAAARAVRGIAPAPGVLPFTS